MTFPAKGLPELVVAQPEGERLRVDRLECGKGEQHREERSFT